MRNVENQVRDSIQRPSELLDAAVSLITSGPDAPPGACLAISIEGETASSASGLAQAFDDRGRLGAPPPMTVDTRTDLGSVTKILATTSCLMALSGGGSRLLERRLDELLPWTAPCAVGESDVEQLLEHHAGLWEWWPLYLSALDPAAALSVAAGLPLRYAAGAGYHYSDLGFQLLGAVVAAASGIDLASAFRELVTEPLGLSATSFGTPVGGASVAASSTGDRIERTMVRSGEPYPVTVSEPAGFSWREHVIVGEVNDGNSFHAFNSVSGHAGVFSTTRDLLRFGDGLLASLAGEGHFEAEVVKRFLQAGREPSQGLGFRCWQTRNGPAWGHTGFPGVAIAVLPDVGASVAMVTNRLHVMGTPRATDEMWMIALRAACEHLEARGQTR